MRSSGTRMLWQRSTPNPSRGLGVAPLRLVDPEAPAAPASGNADAPHSTGVAWSHPGGACVVPPHSPHRGGVTTPQWGDVVITRV
jgi:hypothetical protein